MKLNLGGTIRSLRQAQGKTQEQLARALDVTSQAVSRWEAQGSYPDMELIPAIANFFGITIDQLFGYENKREAKIDALLEQVRELDRANLGTDETVEECIRLLREGAAEFPGNRRILYRLGEILSEAGWIRQGEDMLYDAEGYLIHNISYHKENTYWPEAIKIFENLIAEQVDDPAGRDAKVMLIRLYRNMGEYGKATALAQTMPPLYTEREIMLADAADGKERAGYLAKVLIRLTGILKEQVMQALMCCEHHFRDDFPIHKIQGVIDLIHMLFEDGRFGVFHFDLMELYLYMSEHQWRVGDRDGAFASLDKALEHARAYDALTPDYRYGARLFADADTEITYHKGIGKQAEKLPDFWPVWCWPECDGIWREMQEDPRFADWLRRTKE